MVIDLSQRTTGNKKQRAFHMNDATHERLGRAAELKNATMSAVLDELIWTGIKLPGDPEQLELSVAPAAAQTVLPPEDPPEQPLVTGREAEIANRVSNDVAIDPNKDPNVLNRRAMERLRKSGRFATKDDGSDQRERDPGLVEKPSKGGDSFDI